MGIPFVQKARVGSYILKQALKGNSRYPLVLMLEPLFRCNLACSGCGKIDHPDEVLDRRLTVEECVEAANECAAPVVSIPGGEPLLHPEIDRIVGALTRQKRFVYLCTNAVILKSKLDMFEPSPYLTLSIHLDGLRDKHDESVCRTGVFDKAVGAIRAARERGFRVTTNTTLYGGDTPGEVAVLLDFLTELGVEGMTLSPGFAHQDEVDGQFLDREKTTELFSRLWNLGEGRDWPLNHSGLYLDFLAGREDYRCRPWGNPTRNIFGWQRPCYLLEDGYAGSFRELMETTDWDRYGRGRDPRCEHCMVHSGYEPAAVYDTARHPVKALLAGLRREAGLAGRLAAPVERLLRQKKYEENA